MTPASGVEPKTVLFPQASRWKPMCARPPSGFMPGIIWNHVGSSGIIWGSEIIWDLISCGIIWNCRESSESSGIIQDHLGSSEIIQDHLRSSLGSSDIIWDHLGSSPRSSRGSSGTIWDHLGSSLGSSGIIWGHLKSSEVIWDHPGAKLALGGP